MPWDAAQFTQDLRATVNAYDRQSAVALCDALVAHLFGCGDAYPSGDAERALQTLRNKRQFDLLQKVADAFILTGRATLKIRRQYTQALIDQGNLTAALSMLNELVRDTAQHPGESAEARGLMGRVYKQRYVNANQPTVRHNQQSLELGARCYLEVYERDPRNYLWHGINVAALLSRARSDGISLSGFPQPEKIAKEILEQIEAKDDEKQAAIWDYATALEACVALNDPKAALVWLAKYLSNADADAFEFASTLRQLSEVWRLDADANLGPSLLPPLRAALLSREGGRVDLAPDRLAVEKASAISGDAALEKVFGAAAFKTFKWYLNGVERCRAVARIGLDTERGEGTGFLVKGSDLHPKLNDEFVLVTNAHVVSNDVNVGAALRSADAVITFEALDAGLSFSATKEPFWSSPPHELDATILRLDQHAGLEAIAPYTFAKNLPLNDGKQRVYIAGHPGGGTLCVSLQDNLLLDHDERRLHYRTPTEGGSSGSPVFNEKWELIALHHAGGANLPRLNGQPGSYEANEGISLSAIKSAMAKEIQET